jgi:hypothetical protein
VLNVVRRPELLGAFVVAQPSREAAHLDDCDPTRQRFGAPTASNRPDVAGHDRPPLGQRNVDVD